jgi:hypothetical protein
LAPTWTAETLTFKTPKLTTFAPLAAAASVPLKACPRLFVWQVVIGETEYLICIFFPCRSKLLKYAILLAD